ncbi:hypothetical protein, partial [Pantoea sp. USHLN256]|uniref:hypothetical protein n=1 Tax=Pantoea sp. USHLN256 TaxID=3081293 RepID=UPI00301AD1B7
RVTPPISTGMDSQPAPLVMADAAGIFAASPKPRFARKIPLALIRGLLAHFTAFNGMSPC